MAYRGIRGLGKHYKVPYLLWESFHGFIGVLMVPSTLCDTIDSFVEDLKV